MTIEVLRACNIMILPQLKIVTTCNGIATDGAAMAIVNSGGTGTYTYLWDAAAGNQTTSRAIPILSAGTYTA